MPECDKQRWTVYRYGDFDWHLGTAPGAETIEVMPVSEHEAALAAVADDDDNAGAQLSRLEDDLLYIHDALADPDEPSAINARWIIDRIEALKAEAKAPRQADEPMTERARVAAQDRGAQLGMLRTQTDAYALGECGIAALHAALEVPDA